MCGFIYYLFLSSFDRDSVLFYSTFFQRERVSVRARVRERKKIKVIEICRERESVCVGDGVKNRDIKR